LKHAKTDRLEHALFASMPEIALLDAGAEIELGPRRFVLVAPVVAHLDVVPAVEVELPHVLHHGITPDAPASAIMDVIEHLAVVHQRAQPLVGVATVAAVPRRGREGVAQADQMY